MVFTGRDEDVTVTVGGDATGANRAIDSVVGQLTNLRKKVGLAGGALAGLAGGGLAAATDAAADFEEAMVEVEKVTNPETAAEMSDRIREMASEMPVAQDELAGIASQAGRFGIEGSDNIENFTESVSQMAIATDLSADEAGEAFARMTTLMDEPVENVENVGSVVNELSNTMATSASEITNAATRSSGQLSQLGLQSDEILSLNATMNEVSSSSRIAGTRLRRFAQEMMDPGKAEDLAGALGMSVDEFRAMRENDPNALMEEMVQRFSEGGESADALRETLSTTSRSALSGLAENTEGWADAQEAANEQIEDGTSLQEEYAAAADTFNSKVQVLRNRVMNAAIGIGEDLLPVMTDLVETITGAFDAFDDLNESLDGINVGTIALVSTALAGLTAAAIAFAPAAAAAAAGIAAIAAPVVALAAVIAALWVAWEENLFGIQEIVDEVLGDVSQWFEDSEELIDSAIGAMEDAIGGLVDVLRTVLRIGGRVFEAFLLPVLDRVGDAIGRNLGPILEELDETFRVVANRARQLADFMQESWQEVDHIVVPIVRTLGDILGRTLGAAIDQLSEGIQFLLNLIQGDFEEAMGNLEAFLTQPFETALDVGGIILDSIKSGLKAAKEWLLNDGVQLMTEAFNWIAGTGEGGGLPALVLDGFTAGIKALGGWLKNSAQDVFDAIKNFIKNAVLDAITLGLTESDLEGSQVQGAGGSYTISVDGNDESAATGGLIERGGLLNVHAGEAVAPAAQVTDRGEVSVDVQEGGDDGAAGGDGPQEVVVRFEGEGGLVDLVRREATVTVEQNNRQLHRTRQSMNARPGGH